MNAKPASPIILVEDDRDDELFVRRALEKAHIVNPTVHFRTGSAAKSHFQSATPAPAPALFILDVHLAAGESGIDFLRWLRTQRAPLGSTATMMLTGSQDPHDRDDAELLGSIYFLRKPVTDATLTEAVESLGFIVSNSVEPAAGRIIERRW